MGIYAVDVVGSESATPRPILVRGISLLLSLLAEGAFLAQISRRLDIDNAFLWSILYPSPIHCASLPRAIRFLNVTASSLPDNIFH